MPCIVIQQMFNTGIVQIHSKFLTWQVTEISERLVTRLVPYIFMYGTYRVPSETTWCLLSFTVV
jgi:hypothetical protein